jgi:hypothetical protein
VHNKGSPVAPSRPRVPETDDVEICHGYPVISATRCDDWYFGAMNPFYDDEVDTSGDAYVISPDGKRADLFWQIGVGTTQEILGPDGERWGGYSIWFPNEIRSIEDLVFGFRFVLPDLKKIYAELQYEK